MDTFLWFDESDSLVYLYVIRERVWRVAVIPGLSSGMVASGRLLGKNKYASFPLPHYLLILFLEAKVLPKISILLLISPLLFPFYFLRETFQLFLSVCRRRAAASIVSSIYHFTSVMLCFPVYFFSCLAL